MNEPAPAPRILFLGAGAVGGYVGAHFVRDGADVVFADPWPEHVNRMRAAGLRVEGMTDEECFTVPVNALHLTDLQSLAHKAPIDIAFVCVKSYDTNWAAVLAHNYLAPAGFMVSLQNGINEPTIAQVAGWGATVGCVASKIVVELTEPGRVVRGVAKGGEAHTVFRVGEIHGEITPRIELLHKMLAKIDSAKVTRNLWGERWSKLVANAMSNGLSAASGLTNKEYTANAATRRLSIRLAGEAIATGNALGYRLETISGLAPEVWLAAAEQISAGRNDQSELNLVEEHMIAGAQRMGEEARPSMAQDIRKGRRTEIDYLNGLVVARAQEVGVAVPANERLIAAVRAVEAGAVRPNPDLVSGI